MTVKLILGDCLEVMATLDENSVDTIITDSPYGLEFMGKDWDRFSGGLSKKEDWGHGNLGGLPRQRRRNIKCPECDKWIYTQADRACTCGGIRRAQMQAFEEFNYTWAVAGLRVAKPGATLMAFGGTRTHHRLMCAIEDAGWELRDVMMWVYGTGLPKSHDISKAIDKAAGAERERIGDYGQGFRASGSGLEGWRRPAHAIDKGITAPATDAASPWDGWGTALKPAWEPIIVAMAPRDGTFANNALTWGVAGLNIDGSLVETEDDLNGGAYAKNGTERDDGWGMQRGGAGSYVQPEGRWPANLVHDGSDEVTRLFPDSKGQQGDVRGTEPSHTGGEGTNCYGEYGRVPAMKRDDSGSAARFFYCAKASRRERNAGCEEYGNRHPTVKPLALMCHLAKLTRTPSSGVILDPFMGSGTTGMAAVYEGRDFIGIELEQEYLDIATTRIQHAVDESNQPRQISF